MPFAYQRTIHFSDTDAAGVVFFPNYFAICHEAYEESLAAAGIDLQTFFSDHGVVVPVTTSRAEYLRPLTCGNRVRVTLAATPVEDHRYTIAFELHRLGPPDKLAARVHTTHLCISSRTRERLPLPAPLAAWLRASLA